MASTSTRKKRKRTSSPVKRTAVEVESPPKRKIRKRSEPELSPQKILFMSSDDDSPTFAAKSFYGRKRVPKTPSSTSSPVVVLSPLGERYLVNVRPSGKQTKRTSSQSSLDSQNSQASGYATRRPQRNSAKENSENVNSQRNPKRKSSLSGKAKKNKTAVIVTKNLKGSLTPAMKEIANENTLVKKSKSAVKSSGKKFFRTKSPASADKMLGSIIVRKGFKLKFVPKRLSGNMWSSSTKSSAKKVKKAPKKKYAKLRMANGKSKKSDTFLWESENSSEDVSKPDNMKRFDRKVFDSLVSVEKCDNNDNVQTEISSGLDLVENSPVKIKKLFSVSSNDSKSRRSAKISKMATVAKSEVNIMYTSCVSVEKCDFDSDRRLADGRLADSSHMDTSMSSSQSSASVFRGSAAKPSQCVSGSQDLFGFDSLCSEEVESPRTTLSCSVEAESPAREECSEDEEAESKLFPIFDPNMRKKLGSEETSPKSRLRTLRSSPRLSPGFKFAKDSDGMEQMIIDVGQKNLGAIQCDVCNMLYTQGDPADETDHAKIHQALLNTLSFPGWKKERVVQEFPNDGSRVLMVLSSDPKYATKKVEEINKVMSKDLGFPEQSVWIKPHSKVFLYVSDDKEVEGCVVAESVTEGYRVIADSQAGSQATSQLPGRPWCCATDPDPALVGISRLWVHSQYRRKGVASKLVDTVRQVFEHGVLIDRNQVAFSDPTSDGKRFATRYSGTPAFLVYKYA